MTRYAKILCIDVGGTYTKYSLLRLDKKSNPSPHKEKTVTGKGFLPFIKGIINKYKKGDFDCTSIGFPGITTEKMKISAENINVKNLDLSDVSLNKPIYIANDVFCNALAQLNKNEDKKVRVLVIIGTSIAMALIHEGKIITGKNNIFGEVSDIGFELGMLYLKNNNLTDFSFIKNLSNLESVKYFNKVSELIKLISAIFAPDQIVFGGGVVFHHWSKEFRLKLKESTKQLFSMYRPEINFQQEKDFDNIKGISLLPTYMQKI